MTIYYYIRLQTGRNASCRRGSVQDVVRKCMFCFVQQTPDYFLYNWWVYKSWKYPELQLKGYWDNSYCTIKSIIPLQMCNILWIGAHLSFSLPNKYVTVTEIECNFLHCKSPVHFFLFAFPLIIVQLLLYLNVVAWLANPDSAESMYSWGSSYQSLYLPQRCTINWIKNTWS